MAISSTGIGSGLDVKSIVSQLVELEKRPLTKLQTTAASIQTRISAYADVKSLVSTFSDAASKLTLDSSWNVLSTTSSNPNAVSASVTGLATATSFSMEVQQLARVQSTASPLRTALDTDVGAGTLSIQLGSWADTDSNAATANFTPGTAAAVNISLTGSESLTEIAALINDKVPGVTATILRDGSGERLMMRSDATGEASGFRVQVTESGAPGLSSLSFDPEIAPGVGMAASSATYQPQLALDTQAKLNGIAIRSANTTFKDVIPGLTINVSQVTDAPVEIKVAADTAAMKKNIQAFVDAYNAINDYLSKETKYDEATQVAGVLQGDSTAVALQNGLRNLVTSSTAGQNVFKRLADVGINFQRGGKLAVNATELDAALQSPAELKAMFAAKTSAGAVGNGLAVRVKEFTAGLLSFDGLMNSRADALEASYKRNSNEQEKVNLRVAGVEKRLLAQYAALDSRMAGLTALNAYVAQQVTLWNKSS